MRVRQEKRMVANFRALLFLLALNPLPGKNLKNLTDIMILLGRSFYKLHPIFGSQFLALKMSHFPVIHDITLSSNEDHIYIWICLLNSIYPLLNMRIASWICYRVNYDDRMRSFVEGFCDVPELFLACGVPDVQVYGRSIYIDAFAGEIYSYCAQVLGSERPFAVPQQHACFADSTVSDYQILERLNFSILCHYYQNFLGQFLISDKQTKRLQKIIPLTLQQTHTLLSALKYDNSDRHQNFLRQSQINVARRALVVNSNNNHAIDIGNGKYQASKVESLELIGRVLAVDKELDAGILTKEIISTENSNIVIKFKSKELKLLRSCLQGFFKHLDLAAQTIQQFQPEK